MLDSWICLLYHYLHFSFNGHFQTMNRSRWKYNGPHEPVTHISIIIWLVSEKAVGPHSSTLAWRIPWTEEPGRLQSMRSLGVGQVERLHFPFSLSCIGEGHGNPLQCSCLENPRDGGAWWAAVSGVAQSRTRLKRLSSSSSMASFVVCKLFLPLPPNPCPQYYFEVNPRYCIS